MWGQSVRRSATACGAAALEAVWTCAPVLTERYYARRPQAEVMLPGPFRGTPPLGLPWRLRYAPSGGRSRSHHIDALFRLLSCSCIAVAPIIVRFSRRGDSNEEGNCSDVRPRAAPGRQDEIEHPVPLCGDDMLKRFHTLLYPAFFEGFVKTEKRAGVSRLGGEHTKTVFRSCRSANGVILTVTVPDQGV